MNHESPPEVAAGVSRFTRILASGSDGILQWGVSIQSSVTWKVRVQGDQNMTCRLENEVPLTIVVRLHPFSTFMQYEPCLPTGFWSNLWTAKTCWKTGGVFFRLNHS